MRFWDVGIPGIFALGWMAFSLSFGVRGSDADGVSPYGVYLLCQRHYTLTVLWVIASLACLVESIRLIRQQKFATIG